MMDDREHVDHNVRYLTCSGEATGRLKSGFANRKLQSEKGGLEGTEGLWQEPIRQHQMVQMLTRHSLLPFCHDRLPTTSDATFYFLLELLFSLHSISLLLASSAASPTAA